MHFRPKPSGLASLFGALELRVLDAMWRRGAEVSVRDFGAGLPKDRPDKVFDHFFSTKQTGMGMGLTIVRSIIEMHGGKISAENLPDRGARFSFHLPAARRDSKSEAA